MANYQVIMSGGVAHQVDMGYVVEKLMEKKKADAAKEADERMSRALAVLKGSLDARFGAPTLGSLLSDVTPQNLHAEFPADDDFDEIDYEEEEDPCYYCEDDSCDGCDFNAFAYAPPAQTDVPEYVVPAVEEVKVEKFVFELKIETINDDDNADVYSILEDVNQICETTGDEDNDFDWDGTLNIKKVIDRSVTYGDIMQILVNNKKDISLLEAKVTPIYEPTISFSYKG